MQITAGGTIVTSPSDLSAWAACEWAFLRRLDTKLGRADPIEEPADDMLARTARLGDAHELRYLEALERRMPVVRFDRPGPDEYASAALAAADAMRAEVPALYQATFYDGSFVGFADFIVRNGDGAYEVYDTKLARHAKIPALLQLAAYAEQIERLAIPVSDTVRLVLGNGAESVHALPDIAPVFRRQRDRLRGVLAERLDATEPLTWADPRYTACGRCVICATQTEHHRDLVLVANMHLDQRRRLIAGGIRTIDDLANHRGDIAALPARTLDHLRRQASLQIETERDRAAHPNDPHRAPRFDLISADALRAIPEPDPGDIFFDFEGDPLYTEDGRTWGLDYLFGLVESDETFRSFWAHDIAAERAALESFLTYVADRRRLFPRMHIYHYAAYERTHLLSLAARHGVGEEAVDSVLRENVLVDLYPIVRKALLVGSPSYSIKKLEPLYMGTDYRSGDVQTATASIQAYADAVEILRSGDTAEGERRLADIADYNEYDCVSTLRLRDWLRGLRPNEPVQSALDVSPAAAGAGEAEAEAEGFVEPESERAPSAVYVALSERIGHVDALHRTADETAIALAAAAIDYHRREAKTFWWEHFDRLRNPVDDWADTRDVLVIERAEVTRPWGKLPRARTFSRELRVSGRLAPGSRIRVGGTPYVAYDAPPPPHLTQAGPGTLAAGTATVIDWTERGDRCEVLLKESVRSAEDAHDDIPVAIAPAAPPRAHPQPAAIEEWGARVLAALPTMLPDPAFDLLRRTPPRGSLAAVRDGDTVAAVTASVLDLDHSYLAIQGPPGTGKTYVGSNVVARLVLQHGWKIGVAGQSHAVVEHFLDAVVHKGVPSEQVIKGVQKGSDEQRRDGALWTPVSGNAEISAAIADATVTGRGVVVGGTAWTFANETAVPRQALDLLVIDEAGQFSLAPTIAASVSARRLLLLGDPQQLPQVSQGAHPEPVDQSALGWLADGHDVLPSAFGYFLAETHRMHPALTTAVSDLSYSGMLRSRAPERRLVGVDPGVHVVPVEHVGNTTASPEEAARVVQIAQDLLGRAWTAGGTTRPLDDADIIVVAPYNAQTAIIRRALDAAGLRNTQVGTVDMFQGREAVVAIVSLAASSAAGIPRGLDFLLMPNRLNVAISRAQWAAFIVHSPALTAALPTSVAQLGLLSRFIGVLSPHRPITTATMAEPPGIPSMAEPPGMP
ncbi:TM0106 family RecB-like putative nuclease [Curtobacterium ammoniigenes]|uniref:TM0106 family RecB-like putative nuclease n=1 Tax=Curtobacterium ammoniigenes TaxID=395387 RepID=UPI0009F9CA70|nr:bifunctional RecB family nuclease/DEAD/DEAH box helicase [Curtobacterium ammoniigenes]